MGINCQYAKNCIVHKLYMDRFATLEEMNTGVIKIGSDGKYSCKVINHRNPAKSDFNGCTHLEQLNLLRTLVEKIK